MIESRIGNNETTINIKLKISVATLTFPIKQRKSLKRFANKSNFEENKREITKYENRRAKRERESTHVYQWLQTSLLRRLCLLAPQAATGFVLRL